jgi:hypothetical protein
VIPKILVSDPYAPLSPHELVETPFRYFLADRCLAPEMETRLLSWLEGPVPWKLVATDFYEQFEFDLRDAMLPEELDALVAPKALERLCGKMERALGCRLGPRVDIVAHRLDPGQRIAIHNDLCDGGETHRLTVQLNRGLSDKDGGFFMLFNSDVASDVHRILRPVAGSAIGFAISAASYHAVSRLYGGTRYTLVYSFHAAAASA